MMGAVAHAGYDVSLQGMHTTFAGTTTSLTPESRYPGHMGSVPKSKQHIIILLPDNSGIMNCRGDQWLFRLTGACTHGHRFPQGS